MSKEQLSVGNSIKALALINIQDIFRFTITAKDEEIRERYGSEESAVCVAEKYLDIALKAGMLEHALAGWNMNYTMPIKDSDERADYTAYFYNKYKEAEEAPAEPAENREEATAKPVSADAPTTEAPKPKATVKRRIPQETIDKIVELTNECKTTREIAEEVGVSVPTVSKYQREVMDCEE